MPHRFLSGMRRRAAWPDAELAVYAQHPWRLLGTATSPRRVDARGAWIEPPATHNRSQRQNH